VRSLSVFHTLLTRMNVPIWTPLRISGYHKPFIPFSGPEIGSCAKYFPWTLSWGGECSSFLWFSRYFARLHLDPNSFRPAWEVLASF